MPPKGSKKLPNGDWSHPASKKPVFSNPTFENFEDSPERAAAFELFTQRLERLELDQRQFHTTASTWMNSMDGLSRHYGDEHLRHQQVADLNLRMRDLLRQVQNPARQSAACRAGDKLSTALVIRHLPEAEGETPEALEQRVLNIFGDCPLDKTRIVSMSRLGQPRTPRNPERPRLVLVQFKDMDAKLAVKRQGWKLAGKKISMDHALTLDQLQQRAAQWPLIQAAKERGLKWSWSDVEPHKLIVKPRRLDNTKTDAAIRT